MPYQWAHVAEPHRHQWLLKRNCALSPYQLGASFGVLGLVSMGIATAFAAHGAWLVVPFAGIEVVALAAAFIVYGRHAGDYERIVVDRQGVLVEMASADNLSSRELHPSWIRIEYQGRRRELIRLVAGREALTVGRFVPDDKRATLAQELRTTLAQLSFG
jgi:uncharacterized membrane protein